MTRGTALAIGVAALVAGTSIGVIKARSDEGVQAVTPSAQIDPVGSGGVERNVDGQPTRPIEHILEDGRLISYASCGEFVDAVRLVATEQVGPWGWEGNGFNGSFRGGFVEEELAVADGVAAAAPAPAEEPSAASSDVARVEAQAGVDFSVTNVQERGIDEPDIVKTDGSTIYVVAQSSLYSVDVTGSEPRLLDRLELNVWGAQLLLTGDQLLVIGQGGFTPYLPVEPDIEPGLVEPDAIAPHGGSGTTLTLVDVSQPERLTVAETLNVEGGYITARLTGKSIRLVTSSFPEAVPFVYPDDSGFIPELAAGLENQRIVAGLGASDWLPEYIREDHVTGASESGLAVGCSSVRMPVENSGFGMLSVLTLDPERGLSPVDSDAVMTDAQIVYASNDGLYVSTPFWSNQSQSERGEDFFFGGRQHTLVHRFDISEPFDTAYTGSGEVVGSLLNQFSMSEHNGYLRVASTDHSEQESYVTVLDARGEELKTVGRVGNLGLGEQIYAVRFMGDTGYVVTFRQIDPLYTVDLSNPERPKVLGELKIKGYSAYLHPVGENLLLGIGQDANDQGQTKGTQLSLFDVSDLEDPTRLHQMRLGQGSNSEAEYDHHAFLWWDSLKLAVLPVTAYRYDERTGAENWFSGAVGAEVDADRGINPVGTLAHPEGSQIRRSVVIGDTLYTVSDTGLKASSLETFGERGWLPLS
ncbi:MAG: beta-propeller domain-containing protein [Gaiellaceae bacterium]